MMQVEAIKQSDLTHARFSRKTPRLNSPITARQRVEAILQARRHGVEESVKTSPVALLKEAMVEQAREIVELKQKLAKHEQGSPAPSPATSLRTRPRVWPTASSRG